jgi:glycosyltransferase involved in cell wall biosynthesis
MKSKKILKKGINVSLTQGKKIIKKSPRAAGLLRRMILDYVNIEAAAIANTKYQMWVLQNYPDAVEIMHEKELVKKFTNKPLISILVPTYNTKERYLTDCVESVLVQTYDNWELILVDDASSDPSVRRQIEAYAEQDSRIRYHFRTQNGHISAATNDALQRAGGEFIALLDHDDVLWPNALFVAAEAINEDETIDFIYTDEDKITDNRWEHRDIFQKPDWNPEFLESVNYITHFSIIRKQLVQSVGGFRDKYNGAQDWDLFLRVGHAARRVYHVPRVVYSWRISETSAASGIEAKPYAKEAQRLAIVDSLVARKAKGAIVEKGLIPDYWNVIYRNSNPKISIVIPSKNQGVVIKTCIDSILKKTAYKNYEIIIVDTGTTDTKVLKWYMKLQEQHKCIKVYSFPEQPFSYARACNYGVDKARSDYVLLLNNDIEVITPKWIDYLLSDAQRDGIGAVGCKLYYPGGKQIQHAGIGIGLGGAAANLLSTVSRDNMTLIQHLYADTRHELTAVTAACMLVKKKRFLEVGGFDEKFRVTYNDVDLCLKLREAGYRNIYNPHAQLIHHESISVGLPENIPNAIKAPKGDRDKSELETATKLFRERWSKYILHDPHLNDAIDHDTAFLDPCIEPIDSVANKMVN